MALFTLTPTIYEGARSHIENPRRECLLTFHNLEPTLSLTLALQVRRLNVCCEIAKMGGD